LNAFVEFCIKFQYLQLMNFNYSYRAFLITSLLTGCLVLMFLSIKISNTHRTAQETTYDIIYAPEELLETMETATLSAEKIKIETNRAYNEAEKFIAAVENENLQLTETTEGKLQEMEKAMANSTISFNGNRVSDFAKAAIQKNKKYSNSESRKDNQAIVEGGNRNTTISYRLLDREDLLLPNPVYTCYGAGRVVINIEVDNLGSVKKTAYNKAASTTSNQCLVDAAIEYASQARFTTDASRTKQLGTITFNFPGQK